MAIDAVIGFIGSVAYRLTSTRPQPEQKAKEPRPQRRNSWHRESGQSGAGHSPFGPFANAHDFDVHDPVMIENINNPVTMNNSPITFQTMVSNRDSVLETLKPYAEPRAEKDSSDRHPPPSCHPETRTQIRNQLTTCFNDQNRRFNMTWLRGFAGTGKSAVAQTFADECDERGVFGAAFFFSRLHGWNKSKTVIPSLAFQLATHCPSYKSALAPQLANDPHLTNKSPPVQFKKLIVYPLLKVQGERQRRGEAPLEPFLVVLDGLDECESEDAQCELIELIAEAVRVHKGLPLVWLVCSRPEEHLKSAFTQIIECGREELAIDDNARADTSRFLRAGFAKIKTKYSNMVPSEWPSPYEFEIVERAVNGLFVFASAVLSDIGNPVHADPVGRLGALLSLLQHVGSTINATGSTGKLLETLDLFYSRILDDIPTAIFPVTWRILAYSIHLPAIGGAKVPTISTLALCNFLHITQFEFYGALRNLHSVIDIPTPEDADKAPLRFYHASFEDFLVDPQRSKEFHVAKQKALVQITKSVLFWHEFDALHFHSADGTPRTMFSDHEHGPLPNLKWVSGKVADTVARTIVEYVDHTNTCWRDTFNNLNTVQKEPDLLSYIHNLDFRYLNLGNVGIYFVTVFLAWVYQQDPSSEFARTEPRDDIDQRLLSYLKIVVKEPLQPVALFSIKEDWGSHERDVQYTEYFFIGYGSKSIIVWERAGRGGNDMEVRALNSDREPTPAMIRMLQ